MAGIFNGFENSLGQAVYTGNGAKTYSGQLLAQDEVNELKDLVQKDYLEAGDLRRLAYLLAGNEQKLLNYDEKIIYIISKYLTRIQQAIGIQQTRLRNLEILKENKQYTPTTIEAIDQAYKILDEDIKKMINCYLFASRSSLSLRAKGFNDLSTNRNETVYSGNVPYGQQVMNQGQNQSNGFLGFGKK